MVRAMRAAGDEFTSELPPAEILGRRPSVRLAEDGLAEVESPARRLQRDLEDSWRAAAAPRWSARRTLAFVLLTNGLFWGSLAYGLKALL